MNTRAADELGRRVADLVRAGETEEAYDRLAVVLAQRTPFVLLDRVGREVGAGPLPEVNGFLQRVADGRTEGGWVVIGRALGGQIGRDMAGAFDRCRAYVVEADVWYGADILGERVPGPALLANFADALALLAPWREDGNPWVRRTVGVAAHFWTKRAHGAPAQSPRAGDLLAFLAPMFGERDLDAVKGVGWGLKTLGHYYPDLLVNWLADQAASGHRPHRSLMLQKALTYLSPSQREHATRVGS